MRNVLSFLKPYRLPIIIAYSLTLIELSIELLLPFFLGKMINIGVMDKDINNIFMWGSIMIALALTSFIAGVINSFYASHASLGFSYDIREKLFAKIQAFSFTNLADFPTSGLITRFTNDVRQLQNTIFMALRIMSKAPLLVVGGVLMALIVNAKLALIFLITVPVLAGFLFWVLKKAAKMFDHMQKKVDQMNRIMQENLSGIRLIKVFLRRDYEEKRFKQANEGLATITRSTFRFVESSMPVLLFVMNLSLIFIIWFGNMQIQSGSTAVGDVVAIINYAMRVAMAISMFTFIIMAFSRGKASAERISAVLDTESDSVETESLSDQQILNGCVMFQDVSFNYPNAEKLVLQKINFNLHANEKLAIIGATGSGKTSLLQLIPRLYEKTAGEIFIDGQPINTYPIEILRLSIGYVPQTPLLFTGTISENILFGKNDATEKEVIAAAKAAQIHETIMKLPAKYETMIGQKGVNLSGGQKQRISIARALIRRPKILMFDDSTSALDLATEKKLLTQVQQYNCTMIIVTQKVTTAKDADKIALIDHGRLIALATHEELLEQSTTYQNIVTSQFGKERTHAN